MKKLLTFSMTMAALMLASCGPKKFNMSCQTKELQLGDSIETDSLVINGSDGNCQIEHSAEWIKAEMHDSVLTYTSDANTTGQMREDSIVIRCGASTFALPVKQLNKATKLEFPDGKQITFPKEGGVQELQAISDGLVKVQPTDSLLKADWKDGKLTVTAPKNDGNAINTTLILIAGDIRETVSVIIKGNICQTCNGAGKITCTKCHGNGHIYQERHNDGVTTVSDTGCSTCGGSGWETADIDDYSGQVYMQNGPGVYSYGSGKQTCPTCGGKGK